MSKKMSVLLVKSNQKEGLLQQAKTTLFMLVLWPTISKLLS